MNIWKCYPKNVMHMNPIKKLVQSNLNVFVIMISMKNKINEKQLIHQKS